MNKISLPKGYYTRQLFFGLGFAAFFILNFHIEGESYQLSYILYFTILCVLYPYSRYVYERIVSFIMGENLFILPLVPMLLTKLITMALCYCLAFFIAPIGLLFSFYTNKKSEDKSSNMIENI